MKNGQCPRCGSTNVYTRQNGIKSQGDWWGLTTTPPGSTFTVYLRSDVDTYLCTSCGYFENYVLDEGKLAEVPQKWNKAG